MTKLQLHVLKWKDCKKCPLHLVRTNVVFCRGSIPCDVLFIGEAPGRSEDVVGQPFVGPAGHLINGIITEAFTGTSLRWCMTNLVCCIPLNDDNDKLSQPDHGDIIACRPRLNEFIEICNPRMIVRVGALAQKYTEDYCYTKSIVDILHPAAIIRKPLIQQHYDKKKCVIQLKTAIASL